MSDDTIAVAPEADPAVPETTLDAPGDVEAVDPESAELRKRFNGLMAKHQEALTALVSEREQRIAAEARLQEGNNNVSEAETEVLSEVQALRRELLESKLATAKAEALREFPDAEPMADFIAGSSASEIREAARAYAERVKVLRGPQETTEEVTTVTEPVVTPPVTAGSVTVPTIAGGTDSPAGWTTPAEALAESRRIAHTKPGSQEAWDAFFTGTVAPDVTANLA